MSGIQIKDLSFAYEAGGKLILKDINTEIGEGEFVCILGQSGCGKSTLLRLLAGLETATTGEILSDGVAIGEPNLNKGVVFQDYGLFPWMSAGENILLANRILVLGQSPSHIIYDVKITEELHPTRDTLFENIDMMKLRITLINQINKDVTTHI